MRTSAAEEIKRGVVCETEQKGARIFDAVEQAGPAGELDEHLLQQVAGVGLVARELEQKAEQRRRVRVVEAGEIGGGRHWEKTRQRRRFVCFGPDFFSFRTPNSAIRIYTASPSRSPILA